MRGSLFLKGVMQTMETITQRAVLYLRYSSNNQTEQSIEGQRRVCEAYAGSKNIKIVDEYIDRAASASHDVEKRTAFQRMLKDLSKKRFDSILVYKLDRFARDRYDFAIARQKLKKANVKLISATENLDSDKPETVIFEGLLESMAEYYSAELSQKVRRGIRESVEKRQFIGGTIPLGMKVENKILVPDPKTSSIVRHVFEMAAEGKTFTQIAEWMKDQGVVSRSGNPFGSTSLTRILRNKRYIGYYIYKDLEIPDCIDPIVDKEVYAKVQSILKKNRCKRHDEHAYLLTGKLFCGICGSAMNGDQGTSRNGDSYYYYSCNSKRLKKRCYAPSVRCDLVDDFVIQKTLELLDEDMIKNITAIVMDIYNRVMSEEDPTIVLKERLKDIDKQIENLLQMVMAGHGSEAIGIKIDQLTADKKSVENRIEEIMSSQTILTEDMISYYLQNMKGNPGDPDFRQKMIDNFVYRVYLWSEKDDKKVQIFWTLDDGNTMRKNSEVFDLHPLTPAM